ncbi:MAG: S24 family peptidase [Desulfovermiculus sp.]|nr:S24 family peptidase [Desulfovermiculus sp.]
MPSFADFFNRLCAATPIQSQTELARHLDVNRSAVTQAKERDSVPERWVYKLARDFSLDPDWLSGKMQDVHPDATSWEEYHPVPQVEARLSEQGEFVYVHSKPGSGPYAFHVSWLQGKVNAQSLVLLKAYGESMEPIILNGDNVLVDQAQREIISGRIYVVGIENSILIRRIERLPGRWMLLSSNPNSPSTTLRGSEESVRILGTVVWICRELP